MPKYGTGIYSTLQSIGQGDTVQVWSAEQPVAGAGGASASIAVALAGAYGVGNTGLEVSGFFSGAPGTFEIDVQVSDVDADTQYQTVANGNITSVDATNQTFHFDGSTIKARFCRLLMRTLTNSVNVTATVGR